MKTVPEMLLDRARERRRRAAADAYRRIGTALFLAAYLLVMFIGAFLLLANFIDASAAPECLLEW